MSDGRSRRNIPPINIAYDLFQRNATVRVFLDDRPNIYFQGVLSGFDEHLNIVLEDCNEFNTKTETSEALGKLMLKGDNISVIAEAPGSA